MDKMVYKLELICVKYIPILIAAVVLLNAILSYFDIYVDELNYIAGTSFLTLIPMYISSYAYKFCEYHRMFIHYILTHKLLVIVDMYIGIPLSKFSILIMYLMVAGVFAVATLYIYIHHRCKK